MFTEPCNSYFPLALALVRDEREYYVGLVGVRDVACCEGLDSVYVEESGSSRRMQRGDVVRMWVGCSGIAVMTSAVIWSSPKSDAA